MFIGCDGLYYLSTCQDLESLGGGACLWGMCLDCLNYGGKTHLLQVASLSGHRILDCVKWSSVSSKHILITVPDYGCDVTRFLMLLTL